ncbi:hypothetical protein [Ornithinimicrobium sufpigmenti]|uniref:hypothetical protein n=1 Tax=Ornithinimicrobium sufpigmenti TaxID=2508882 RepID=UPI00192DBE8E|nr:MULTISPECIES: hypothetical protein [unclassified Ornithinimicrobium]
MIDTILFAGFALAYAALLVRGVVMVRRLGRVVVSDVVLLVIAALVYDNAIIAAGRVIGEGPLLEGLNLARFWVHALLTPLLVLFAWHATARAGVRWAQTRVAALVSILVVLALYVLEFVTVLAGLRIEPGWEYGVLSYSDATGGGGPPIMVLVVAFTLLVAGFLVWRRTGWVWLLLGAVLITAGSAVPVPVDSGAITNAFELALLVSILATKANQDHRERAADGPVSP